MRRYDEKVLEVLQDIAINTGRIADALERKPLDITIPFSGHSTEPGDGGFSLNIPKGVSARG